MTPFSLALLTGLLVAQNPPANPEFPRRALIVSTHNYLYANVVHPGPPAGLRNIASMVKTLARGLRIPLAQIAHLSDEAGGGMRRPLTKGVIEKTLRDFLADSRPQDRIVVVLVGHCAEIAGKLYYVPIEGEFDVAAGLIPLAWIFDQMDRCPARQKILIADLNRENPDHGRERPASGPMSARLEAFLKAPPAGVQVVSACSKDGYSYGTEDSPMGVFLDALGTALEKGFQGNIQRVGDLIWIEQLTEMANAEMKRDLEGRPFKQVAFVAGKDRDNNAGFNPNAAPAKAPVLAAPPLVTAETNAAVTAILRETDLPPVKVTWASNRPDYAALSTANLADYASGGDPTPLREKVTQARAVLWAVAGTTDGPIPADLKGLADRHRADLKVDLDILRNGYRLPQNWDKFRAQIAEDDRKVDVIAQALVRARRDLDSVAGLRAQETKRWQAHYDYVAATLDLQTAYLLEYRRALGQLLASPPLHDPQGHTRFRLVARPRPAEGSPGRVLADKAAATLQQLAAAAPGSPWEILAKRAKLAYLGLEGQTMR